MLCKILKVQLVLFIGENASTFFSPVVLRIKKKTIKGGGGGVSGFCVWLRVLGCTWGRPVTQREDKVSSFAPGETMYEQPFLF